MQDAVEEQRTVQQELPAAPAGGEGSGTPLAQPVEVTVGDSLSKPVAAAESGATSQIEIFDHFQNDPEYLAIQSRVLQATNNDPDVLNIHNKPAGVSGMDVWNNVYARERFFAIREFVIRYPEKAAAYRSQDSQIDAILTGMERRQAASSTANDMTVNDLREEHLAVAEDDDVIEEVVPQERPDLDEMDAYAEHVAARVAKILKSDVRDKKLDEVLALLAKKSAEEDVGREDPQALAEEMEKQKRSLLEKMGTALDQTGSFTEDALQSLDLMTFLRLFIGDATSEGSYLTGKKESGSNVELAEAIDQLFRSSKTLPYLKTALVVSGYDESTLANIKDYKQWEDRKELIRVFEELQKDPKKRRKFCYALFTALGYKAVAVQCLNQEKLQEEAVADILVKLNR